jgi:hypothetical protein
VGSKPTEHPWSSTEQAAGKILKDEDTLENYKIEEKGFVVCMVNKVCGEAWEHGDERWRC